MDKLRNLLTPSSFKIGCLVVLASCMVFYSFGKTKPALLASLDNQITSAMFQWRGPQKVTDSVVIVDIDEKSLREMGQWPWPRDTVAALVKSILSAKPKVVGFDMVFPENDRSSPARYADELSGLIDDNRVKKGLASIREREDLDHDLSLGRAVSTGPVVLGYVFQLEKDGLKTEREQPFPSATIKISPAGISPNNIGFISGYRAILNNQEISQAQTEGFLNVFPDSTGMVRKVPLLMGLDGIPYPSIAMEMVRLASGEQELTIHVSRQKSMGKSSVLGVTVGSAFIPTDDKGQVLVNFRGPVKTFEYVSAVDVIKGLKTDALKEKFVIIGTSAAGLLDFHATPFSGIFPGVEIQATIIDNIRTGSLFTYDIFTEIGLTYTIIILGGVMLSALLAFSGALSGGIAGLLFILCVITGNYFLFFLNGRLLGITYPLGTIVMVFLMVTFFNYFFEYRKKQFIHEAFSRYVSPMVVSELMKSPERLSLSGEEKELTILFSDIRNFTTVSEGMDPRQLGIFMNTYLTAMSDIIMEYHGMVDKYIGDAIVAIWGAPLDDPDHAKNAVRAALKMRERLSELKIDWARQDLPPVDIGIGINTGVVSVGNFGSERRFEYTVLGDNVNLASRLESINKVYGTGIIISEYTRLALGNDFSCRKVDTVIVKGKTKPIEIYEPLIEGTPQPETISEVELFEKALHCYCTRNFTEARQIISNLQETRPSPLYECYLARITGYILNPPPEGWHGIHAFNSK